MSNRNEYQKKWRDSNPEKVTMARRKYRLMNQYGLTLEQYDALLEKQGGKCAICQCVPRKQRLAVDHDHTCCKAGGSCGECIRGLLCIKCNRGLGMFKEKEWILERAYKYVRDGEPQP